MPNEEMTTMEITGGANGEPMEVDFQEQPYKGAKHIERSVEPVGGILVGRRPKK